MVETLSFTGCIDPALESRVTRICEEDKTSSFTSVTQFWCLSKNGQSHFDKLVQLGPRCHSSHELKPMSHHLHGDILSGHNQLAISSYTEYFPDLLEIWIPHRASLPVTLILVPLHASGVQNQLACVPHSVPFCLPAQSVYLAVWDRVPHERF